MFSNQPNTCYTDAFELCDFVNSYNMINYSKPNCNEESFEFGILGRPRKHSLTIFQEDEHLFGLKSMPSIPFSFIN